MAQTLCPACGYMPIPSGAEECPRCHERFDRLPTSAKATRSFSPAAHPEEGEQTLLGGNVTSAVTAHPRPTAVVLFVSALVWLVRGSAMFDEAHAGVLMAGLDIAIAAILLFNVGPAKTLAQLGIVVQLIAIFLVGHEPPLSAVSLLFAAQSLVVLSMVTGEPRVQRRRQSALAGCGLGALALIVMLWPHSTSSKELTVANLSLEVPGAYSVRTTSVVALPPAGGLREVLSAGTDHDLVVVIVDRTPETSCAGLISSLKLDEMRVSASAAPKLLGESAQTLEVQQKSRHVGKLSCGKLRDGRVVALLALAAEGDAVSAQMAFEQMGASLTLK